MLSRIYSLGIRGVAGYPVLVELDLANGLPGFTTVGLPDSAVRESRERVASAVRNSGFRFPQRRITVNLAPAQSRKEGTHFDLPIALAVLSASGQVPSDGWPARYCFVGELALDGRLRPVPGVLSMAMRAKAEGFSAIVVPEENAAEARSVGLPALSAGSLRQIAEFLSGRGELGGGAEAAPRADAQTAEDLSDVKGQEQAKRALEIAAAGGHNLLLIGPPGAGKSMLARRLITILPELSAGEAVEATRIHSLCGRAGDGLLKRRPFRSPHHSCSAISLIGGGPAARPGEVSLAHGGVLFLDELAEFNRSSLEALRQPLEDHRVVVARARETLEYPARFQLIAATNPCPCGWRGHPTRECRCTPKRIELYVSRLSGPLLDRVDLHAHVAALDFKEWEGPAREGDSSQRARERVLAARERQRERFQREDFAVNAYLPPRDLRSACGLDAAGLEALEAASRKYDLTARSLDRLLRVARTIADLAGSPWVRREHVAEAVQFRGFERMVN